jgi:hypothetical protein
MKSKSETPQNCKIGRRYFSDMNQIFSHECEPEDEFDMLQRCRICKRPM